MPFNPYTTTSQSLRKLLLMKSTRCRLILSNGEPDRNVTYFGKLQCHLSVDVQQLRINQLSLKTWKYDLINERLCQYLRCEPESSRLTPNEQQEIVVHLVPKLL